MSGDRGRRADPLAGDAGAAGRNDADLDALRGLATACVVLALAISVPSSLAFLAAFGGDVEAAIFGHPEAILGGGESAALLLRWGAISDLFYSYLMLVPLVLFLHRRLRPVKPWVADVGAIGAFAYIFVGAAGAAILATVGSSLVAAYSVAAPPEQAAVAASFEVLRDTVYFGLWQMLDPLTAGTWILTVGWLLLRERPLIGRFLIVLSGGLGLLSLMTMLGIHSLTVLLSIVAGVVLVWAGWIVMGRVPLRSPPTPHP